jgi:hypothetical protein
MLHNGACPKTHSSARSSPGSAQPPGNWQWSIRSKDRYQTEDESWRNLQSANIEFTMKRLRDPIEAGTEPFCHRADCNGDQRG